MVEFEAKKGKLLKQAQNASEYTQFIMETCGHAGEDLHIASLQEREAWQKYNDFISK